MKRIFIVTCLLTFAFMVSAQQGGGQGRGFQRTPEQLAQYYADLKKELTLNDKQLADIKKIDEEYTTKQRAAREKGGDNVREEMTKLRTEQTAKIKPLLSADQFKKYEAFLAQRMQRRNNN
jgi:hypothetical protein